MRWLIILCFASIPYGMVDNFVFLLQLHMGWSIILFLLQFHMWWLINGMVDNFVFLLQFNTGWLIILCFCFNSIRDGWQFCVSTSIAHGMVYNFVSASFHMGWLIILCFCFNSIRDGWQFCFSTSIPYPFHSKDDQQIDFVRPEVLTVGLFQIQVVWDMTPCRLVSSYQRFEDSHCFLFKVNQFRF